MIIYKIFIYTVKNESVLQKIKTHLVRFFKTHLVSIFKTHYVKLRY